MGASSESSENGIDPLTGSNAREAVLWQKDGSITNLGTLRETTAHRTASTTAASRRLSSEYDPDPYTGMFAMPGATQSHAFRWTKYQGMQDLGTLGGTDSAAFYVKARADCRLLLHRLHREPEYGCPEPAPVPVENGKMTDLGTLGGTFAGPFLSNRSVG